MREESGRGGGIGGKVKGKKLNVSDSIFHALEKMEVKRAVLYLRMTQEKLMM